MATEGTVFDGVALAAAGDVVLVVWQAAATLPRAKWMLDQSEQALAQNPDSGIIMLQVVMQSSTPPDAATRTATQDRLKRFGHGVRRIVTVPVGNAVWSSIVRTIMRTMYVVTGQSKLQVVAKDEIAGVRCVVDQGSPRTPPADVILRQLDAVYRMLGLSRREVHTAAP